MGPLVPDVVGNELNLVLALFIGMGFGYILEQAGFSTSRKLVGLFYGYDFTVLRVFFTAGVVAMLGVVALGHFGLLDLSLIYINPTFLWSAIVGGVIMGLGFIIGGFCPGTSVCAAAIGKVDAMVFVGGSVFGVLAFSEGYPLLETLYKAKAWGSVTAPQSLGISQGLFAFLLTAMAVAAFWATTSIEKKVNGRPNPEFKPTALYAGLAVVGILVGLSAIAMPDRKDTMLSQLNRSGFVASKPVQTMDADELAYRLMYDGDNLQIFDLHTRKDLDSLTLPNATRVTLGDLFGKEAHKQLSLKGEEKVFVGDDQASEEKAAVLAGELGYPEVHVLKGGLAQIKSQILDFKAPDIVPDRSEADTYRFRAQASQVIPELIRKARESQSPLEEKKPERVLGGC
jgi:rhodanese-related sulfurtransferase